MDDFDFFEIYDPFEVDDAEQFERDQIARDRDYDHDMWEMYDAETEEQDDEELVDDDGVPIPMVVLFGGTLESEDAHLDARFEEMYELPDYGDL